MYITIYVYIIPADVYITICCVSEIQYLFCRYSSHRVSGIADTAPPKYLMCI